MPSTLHHAGRAGLFALKLTLAATLPPIAWAAYASPEPVPAPAPARAVTAMVPALPAEFSAIRPAGIDGPPPIPPSELWPAQ